MASCPTNANNSVIINPNETNTVVVTKIGSSNVIRIVESGPQGKVGPTGPKGDPGDSPPFFMVTGSAPIRWATTSSISFWNSLSSSLIPFTSSAINVVSTFSLGSTAGVWRGLYVSESINFVDSTSNVFSTLGASSNRLHFGDVRIGTSSYGFSNKPIIIKENGVARIDIDRLQVTGSVLIKTSQTQDALRVQSGSFTRLKINKDGLLTLSKLNQLPALVTGSIVYSGSNFFFGV